MQQEQLKSLVETGNYRPKPALVAEAMLQAARGARAAPRGGGRAQPS